MNPELPLAGVGIDDLNVYGSSLCVEAQAIAQARGTPEREFQRLKLIRRSLAPSFEDPVTLAVNAAKPILQDTEPSDFDLLIVATESGVDYGKPLSSYVHRYLGLGHRCWNVEMKHACYAGTAALRLAATWVECHPKRRALVVMSDMARKIFEDPAEPAEGAAAIAISVSANPRILTLERGSGYAAEEIYDVTRPTPTLERANAGLSLGAYLDLLEIAAADYRQQHQVERLQDHCVAICYHTPLVPLVEQAHRVLVESEDEDATADVVAQSFERLVAPSLAYCRELGNIYGGSLYAALAGRIDAEEQLDEGARVGLYSYGSGSCAEFFSGIVAAQATEVMGNRRLAEHLAARHKIGVAEYEHEVLATERSLSEPEFEPEVGVIPELYERYYAGRNLLVLESVQDYYRNYRFS